MSSKHIISSVCHWIADKWDLLFFPHRTRFALEDRRLDTELMRKLIQSRAMCQM